MRLVAKVLPANRWHRIAGGKVLDRSRFCFSAIGPVSANAPFPGKLWYIFL